MTVDSDIFVDEPGTRKGDADIFADEKPSAKPQTRQEVKSVPQQKVPLVPRPNTWDVARNAQVRALTGIGDMVLNAPQNVVNLGRAGIGSLANLAGRPDLAPAINPAPNYLTRGAEAVGLIKPNVVPQDTSQKLIDFGMGGATASFLNPAQSVVGLGRNIATGILSGLAGGTAQEVTGSEAAGMAASMIAPAAVNSAINRGHAAVENARRLRQQNSVNDATLATARKEGYVVPPSEVNPSSLNNRLESFAGKAAIKQEAGLRNQAITTQIAKRELGTTENITPAHLDELRNRASAPYAEVANISPLAANALEELRRSRNQSKMQWQYYERSANPDAHSAAKAADARSQMLERVIEKAAVKAGKPDLISRLREARQYIAKTYDIERGLNLGDASVSAPDLRRAQDRGVPLSGGLKTIADFASGPGRRFVSEGSGIPPPGVSGGEPYAMAGMGALGSHLAGPAGWAAAGIPLLRGPTRNLLLSNAYQNSRLANPNYRVTPGEIAMNNIPQFTPQDIALMSLLQSANQERK